MDNRKRILDVALDLFYEKGYDAVGVQEIVEGAGITKPTLYYYFGSKYGLLEELLKDGFEDLLNRLNEAVVISNHENGEGDYDVPLILYNVAKTVMTFANQNSKFFFFMLSLMYSARGNEPYKAVRPHLLALYQMITELFERLGDKLGNMNGRQETFAMGFLGLLNQYAFIFSEKHGWDDDSKDTKKMQVSDEEIHAIVKQFMYGIVN